MLDIFCLNTRLKGFLLLSLLLILAGCTNLDQTSILNKAKICDDIGILLSATGEESARWEERDRHYLEQEIIKKIPEVTIRYFNANSNLDEQEKQADLALKKGSCLLIVSPVNTQNNIVKKAKDKEVPVIAYDRFIDDDNLDFYISFDSTKVGEMQAEYIIEELDKGEKGTYKLKPEAKIVMINGDIKDANADKIQEGWFKILNDEIYKKKRLNLIFPNGKDNKENYIPEWNGEQAAQKVKELLAQGDIDIIAVANDQMADKIIQNLPEDKKGKILITGQDGSRQSADNIIRNYQGIIVYKSILKIAQKTMEIVDGLSNGQNIKELMKEDTKTSTELTKTYTETSNGKKIPSWILPVEKATKKELRDTLIRDGIITEEELCQGIPQPCL